MKLFLLTYSLTAGNVVDLREFADEVEASAAYVEAEKRSGRDDNYEIVLVGADSEESLRTTHGHYFDDEAGSTSPYLAGV